MSNPFLKPNDPRFQRPNITDADGKNRFAEESELTTADPQPTGERVNPKSDPFAVGAATSDQPYVPRYETTAKSRGVWLLVVAIVGLAGVGTGMTSIFGWTVGWIFPLLATVPSAIAWLLGYQDLQLMRTGAMDEEGETLTRVALWLGLIGLVLAVGSVAAMIWLGLSMLPLIL